MVNSLADPDALLPWHLYRTESRMVTKLTRPQRVLASFALGALLAGLGAADSSASLPTKEAGKVVASGAVAPSAPELKSLGVRTFAPAPKSSPTEIMFQNGIRF